MKNDLNTILCRNLFSIPNDCSVNLSDLSKMLVKKQMKYGASYKVPILQELLNHKYKNEWFICWRIYVVSYDQCRLFCTILHIFSFANFIFEICKQI